MALKQMTEFVHRQATVLAFGVVLVPTVAFVGLAAAGIVMKRPTSGDIAASGHQRHVSSTRPDSKKRDVLYGTEIPHFC
jgi:hypothetical protein